MKRILNTLYITSENSVLSKKGETVYIHTEGKKINQFPLIMLQGIVCFGKSRITPQLMAACAKSGISISFLSPYGRYLAKVTGAVSGNVLLRKEQYRISDDQKRSARLARSIVTGKCANTKMVLQRAVRDHPEKINLEKMKRTIKKLSDTLNKLEAATELNYIRGLEGEAARNYFNVFNELITVKQKGLEFAGRNRRPPLDRVNALLSFIYTLLYHDMRSALECCGLDPAVGFLHKDRPGRMSLALDMMEEFRPVIADRLVLSLLNTRQINSENFNQVESGAILLEDDARKVVLTAYQTRKQDIIKHPFLDKKMHIGIVFHTQAMLMARCIRGDLDNYPPFFWR